jgi:hypothetical protein
MTDSTGFAACRRRHIRESTRPISSVCKTALTALLLLCLAPLDSRAETALEVESWCKPIANAAFGENGEISYHSNSDTEFCWGAFATIEELSRVLSSYSYNDNTLTCTPLIGICAPSAVTRVQMIKIFSKYVDEHPDKSHLEFAVIARLSLAEAFPCREGVPLPR